MPHVSALAPRTPSSPSSPDLAHAHDAEGPYVLGVGDVGFDRLQVSEEAYGRATQRLVAQLREAHPPVWPQGPVSMAVVACGSGAQLPALHTLVGTDGRLFCSDVSAEQVNSAHAYAARLGLESVRFETLDITHTPGPKRYDVVYARFVLVHLKTPQRALEHMWQMVRLGGLLLSEEHNAERIASEPPCPAVDRAKALLLALGQKRGVDYTLGRVTPQLFERAQVPVSGTTCTPISYAGGRPKKLFEMSLREGAQAYIGADLIAAQDMQCLLAELGAFNDRDDTRMVLGDFVQTWARKPMD